MREYSEYKIHPYDWLLLIPAHWNQVAIRAYLSLSNGRRGEEVERQLLSVYRDYGIVPKKSRDDNKNVESEDTSKYKVVEPGYLVINKMKLWQGSLGISEYSGIVSPAYIVCRTHYPGNLRFLNYLLRSALFKTFYNRISYGIRVGQWDSDYQSFRNLVIPVPPCSEQDQIVSYLDWQISRINSLVKGYQRQKSLFEELRLTVINNAVTKGIHECSCRPVDSNWISEIPEHWKFDKVKQHFHIKKDIAGKEGYDVISITQQGLKVKDITTNEGQMAASYAKYQFVNPGEFAMNHMDLLTGYIGLSTMTGVTSPDYRVFVLDDTEKCDPEYYLYIFQLGYKRKIFYGLGRGAANKGRWRMPAENFKNYDIPVPPLEEQKEIVTFIKKHTEQIDELIKGTNKQIDLLREYRTRLISDVVTGQVDVHGIVIPDYTPTEDTGSDSETGDNEEVVTDAE